VIPADRIQDFFFMDNDEEQKEYGFSSKLLSADILNDTKKAKVLFPASLIIYRELSLSRSKTSRQEYLTSWRSILKK
jgi:hypothetical protein